MLRPSRLSIRSEPAEVQNHELGPTRYSVTSMLVFTSFRWWCEDAWCAPGFYVLCAAHGVN